MVNISVDSASVEKNVKSALDFGIGLLRVGEESLQAGLKSIVAGFEELKQKGLQDNSQGAEKLRETLQNSLRGIEKLSKQVQENMDRVSVDAQQSYEKVLKQAKSLLGEEQYAKLNAKVQELAREAQKQGKDIYSKASQLVSRLKESAAKVLEA